MSERTTNPLLCAHSCVHGSSVRACDAQRYTNGINAFLNSSWFALPIEYTLLGVSTVEAWNVVDTLAICRCACGGC
jgi:acyl-homoserine lactone acylase PvdQ